MFEKTSSPFLHLFLALSLSIRFYLSIWNAINSEGAVLKLKKWKQYMYIQSIE